MSKTQVANVDHPTKQTGFIGRLFELMLRIIGILLFSACISVIVEWIGMAFFYEDDSYNHAAQMMKKELSYLNGTIINSLSNNDVNSVVIDQAGETVKSVTTYVFIDSGFIAFLQSSQHHNPQDSYFYSFVKEIVASCYDYLMAAVYILIIFCIRLTILILSLPVFFLFAFVGLADGLMQRDLRRWCGGYESGFIYHYAKSYSVPLFITSWVLYLAIPVNIHPNLIIIPFAILFALSVMLMASKFKKYL